MSSFAERNAHFDRLFATRGLYWLGQNTNHLPMHPAVRKALTDAIDAEEFSRLRAARRLHGAARRHRWRPRAAE